MDALAGSNRWLAALAALLVGGAMNGAWAAPPVRGAAPGRLVARAAVDKHERRRNAEPWAAEVAPAAALQPAEEFFPPPDMPDGDMPAGDMPAGDMPVEEVPSDEAPAEEPPRVVGPSDGAAASPAPPAPAPEEAAPYAAAPLRVDEYQSDLDGNLGGDACGCGSYDRGGCDGSCGWDASCGCGAGCGCDDPCAGGCRSCGGDVGLTAGAEFTFVKPRFNRNVAFTIMNSDGDTFESFTEIEFDYAFDYAPRAWIGYGVGGGRGWRVSYWQYDDEAETASSSPPPNGFGAIIPPTFGDVDIGTTIPTDVFTANSRLDCYTIDLEATHETARGLWRMGASYGVRFASMQQDYEARTRNAAGTLLGQINYYRMQRGAGPTLALTAVRPVTDIVHLFGTARGSVLFGDSDANFFGGEDQDLATAFNTTRVTTRDDVWTIGEIQVGLRWLGRRARGGWQPFASGAAEGQTWNGAGNATSEDGDLGFVGFNIGVGVIR